MNIKIEVLEKILNRCAGTIKVYLARAEFSHIKIEKKENEKFVTNITNLDIRRLKKITDNRRSNTLKPRKVISSVKKSRDNAKIKKTAKTILGIIESDLLPRNKFYEIEDLILSISYLLK